MFLCGYFSFALVGPVCAQFKEVGQEYQRNYPQFMVAFRDMVARPRASTVRVLCDGKDAALGMVVGTDGWILTKAHDLEGKISCKFRDGRVYDAQLFGVHTGHDLALLKIAARGLVPVEFKDSKSLGVGNWIACAGPGEDPVAVGIVSVATRTIIAKSVHDQGYLGIALEQVAGVPRVTQVVADTPAARAGLKTEDILLHLQGKPIANADTFVEHMLNYKVGDVVTLHVKRGESEVKLKATLARRPNNTRGDFQNRMGSELSSRTSGYQTILQHDAVIRPRDCGGPVVDLDGKVIGINICRAGRTESWAIPAEIIQATLTDLFAGRLPPPPQIPGKTMNRPK